ncbi:MAG TPA: gliding motility-associated C-terminal domain-containing protein [Saprospiraceae bacterium]|nr:gliding motility-associated C-terminal domain-containing protein [Saprospiraceae bacterium]HOY12676.1 gliding motility-associated C-terminal domain-containing protein [Saprospiraceae bacterium]HPN67871.1 gliding motility-associated C-terminal domain-containing protein [Saprospiraceae bacterium]
MRPCILFFMLLLNMNGLTAQIDSLCTGNLGENIFLNGSLGRGNTLTLENDPMIAPGYQYLPYLPNDGQYTITQNVEDLFPPQTWINVIDAGGDSLGYFLLFNASYEPSVFYEQLVTGLCPNTLYEFSVEVVNLIARDVTDHIDPNLTFYLDSLEVYSTGNVPRSEHWEKYGLSFTTGLNQTSVTLSIRNNAPGGAGNDLAIDNISFRPCVPGNRISSSDFDNKYTCPTDSAITISADIPVNWAIKWQYSTDSINWSEYLSDEKSFSVDQLNVGNHYYRYIVSNDSLNFSNTKCFITSDVVSVQVLQQIIQKYDTICFGNSLMFGNNTLTASGTYLDTLFNSNINGCDSIIEQHLFVLGNPAIAISPMIVQPKCFGEDGKLEVMTSGNFPPFKYEVMNAQFDVVNGTNFPPGNYTIIAKDVHGCADSMDFAIISPPEFRVDIGPDTTINLGDTLLLSIITTDAIESLEWQPANFVSCPTCPETSANPSEETTFSLVAINEFGCEASDEKSVMVNRRVTKAYTPNIISLQSKDDNNLFSILLDQGAESEISLLLIYDRFGNNVYRSTQEFSWDGYFNGHPAETGVYTYLVEFTFSNGVKEVSKGNFTLVK